ncbi:DUF4395 domain-containing protein [Nocardioides sp. Kera G14]|uniref:DUF4395 domain-containing protein n=1 Tax=Nocardioides sp. Kera G14 TaxID=2884264 RepID=UPI001D11670B|nr:DUF4395 domain-containing protein [Nocardioides sp. Kera G14]UDY23127.1 DUF4395 domain-containing protein [Nocardioides sp. Kera G14]
MSTSGIDPRGPRFTAAVTVVLVLAALVTLDSAQPVALVITALQTLLFAIGAVRGVQHTPTAYVFRTAVRPRLQKPDHLEDPAPPRFAQTVGLVFGAAALIGIVTGLAPLAYVALAFALIAAILNSAFGFCLGCELYLLGKRLNPAH